MVADITDVIQRASRWACVRHHEHFAVVRRQPDAARWLAWCAPYVFGILDARREQAFHSIGDSQESRAREKLSLGHDI